jgi:hypothetical protein
VHDGERQPEPQGDEAGLEEQQADAPPSGVPVMFMPVMMAPGPVKEAAVKALVAFLAAHEHALIDVAATRALHEQMRLTAFARLPAQRVEVFALRAEQSPVAPRILRHWPGLTHRPP